jgi:hypothetical protein
MIEIATQAKIKEIGTAQNVSIGASGCCGQGIISFDHPHAPRRKGQSAPVATFETSRLSLFEMLSSESLVP